MKFLIRKRRAAPAVIIVALIDVLIVLVIFLLATMTFKQQPLVKLALPESTQGLKSGANENPPLLVTVEANGTIRFGADNLHDAAPRRGFVGADGELHFAVRGGPLLFHREQKAAAKILDADGQIVRAKTDGAICLDGHEQRRIFIRAGF